MTFSFKGKPDQRCKGQGSLYDHLLILGPLTDKQIEDYEREGKYGTERQKAVMELDKLRTSERKLREQRAKERVKRKIAFEKLVEEYI